MPADTEDAWTVDFAPTIGPRTAKVPAATGPRTVKAPVAAAPPTIKTRAVIESPLPPPTAHAPGRSFAVVHPRYRQWLLKCGLLSPQSFLALAGDIVSGHPERHVAAVELHAGVRPRKAFLKREHLIGRRTRLRNWLAGFGWVSRCEREAITLCKLEDAGQPGPQWLAYGEHDGQAFLLVEELTGATELRAYLDEYRLSDADRRLLAERIGRAVAELHEAGFGTPELAAKHLFLRPDVMAVSLIDWQSTPKLGPKPVPARFEDRYRWLGQLHATLADELASPADRRRMLWAYRRTVRMTRRTSAGIPKFSSFVREVEHHSRRVANRSSVSAQRQPVPTTSQRLRWLAGEAVVVTPELTGLWPKPIIREPFYPAKPTPTPAGGHREWVTFGDGRQAVLVRFHTVAPFGRLLAALRERSWRSPAVSAARVLFHLQRHGIPAPTLLAFGQRMISRSTAESFLVAEPQLASVSVECCLADRSLSVTQRRALLGECGRMLRQLHDAGCRPDVDRTANDPLFMATPAGEVGVGSPFAVRLCKRVADTARRADLRDLTVGLSHPDRLRVLRGYLGDRWADKRERKAWQRVVA